MNTTMPKRNDIILMISLILISLSTFLIYFLSAEDGTYAVVYSNGEAVGKYPLSEDTEAVISTEYGENMLVIKDGCADITDADCPDGVCVRSRRISRTGETIICLPHRVTVKIEGGEADVDIELK